MRARIGLLAVLLLTATWTVASPGAVAREPAGLHAALDELLREGKFSGAVVLRGREGLRFARGYGWADPFERRAFTPETPADSASLAKPITSAAVLLLTKTARLNSTRPCSATCSSIHIHRRACATCCPTLPGLI